MKIWVTLKDGAVAYGGEVAAETVQDLTPAESRRICDLRRDYHQIRLCAGDGRCVWHWSAEAPEAAHPVVEEHLRRKSTQSAPKQEDEL